VEVDQYPEGAIERIQLESNAREGAKAVSILVEGCVETIDECLNAKRGGARRLELCDRLDVGGTTPSAALIDEVHARVGLPIMAMVRPRGGSFVHTASELDQMRRDLDMVLTKDVAGVVIGVLDDNNRVDTRRMSEFVRLAGDTPVTFHKAFDLIDDLPAALNDLIACGVKRLLTSGGAPTAAEGIDALAMLVERSAGRVEIMAGGKVRGSNVRAIVDGAGVKEVHARTGPDDSQIRAIVDAIGSSHGLTALPTFSRH
jgi:copper homeostasis protein